MPDANSQRQKSRDNTLSSLNVTIEALDLAKEISAITPAKAVFGTVSALLTIIKDSMINDQDYVELGLSCADICQALQRGMNGNGLGDLSQPVCDAMNQLTTTVEEIQRMVFAHSRRKQTSRLFNAKSDKEVIARWKSDLNRVLQVFTTELVVNTHTMVLDLHHNAATGQDGSDGQHHSIQAMPTIQNTDDIRPAAPPLRSTIPGELPPPQPRACFGRDELVERIIGLAETHNPIALIGAGGIGKTSIALTVLHHDRIKEQFGDDRWFIRCDQIPPSRTHLLSRLSTVIGAGIENPEDIIPLRPFLSSRRMIVILDNAESILDPRGVNAQDVYTAVEELSEFSNICICLTSRISTIPPGYETLDVPVLSMEAACATFYGICKNEERPDLVNDILKQLDFHPLSVTLLATVAHHNRWDNLRLTKEWEERRTGVLQTEHNRSLAATIELSLASPMFQELGPDARELLGAIAFFPQGINEDNLDWLLPPSTTRWNIFSWLFPTTSDGRDIFDKFCVLSLTYRTNGFITMLAPLRDYLCPKDPTSSRLLCTTRQSYIRRLRVDVDPSRPGFEEAQWIASEDVNVEHLLYMFMTYDANSPAVWVACADFMRHLYWHKKRLVVLGPKIEALPDDHPSKPRCLFYLSRLFNSVGNYAEYKRLLVYTLELRRKEGNDFLVAETLRFISDANELLGDYKEGLRQAEEALGVYGRLKDIMGQGRAWLRLARLLYRDEKFVDAERAASRAIELLWGRKDGQFEVCGCYHTLGKIYRSKGEIGKAVKHFEKAVRIASECNWQDEMFWNCYDQAKLFFDENRFDDAHAHLERAKSYAVNSLYLLGRAMELQAKHWLRQRRLVEANSEALCALHTYEKIGAAKRAGGCKVRVLQKIQEAMNEQASSQKH